MLTITGSIEEIATVQSLIEIGAAASAGDIVLLDRVVGQDNETGAEVMLTFSIQTKAQREAEQRAFVLSLPGRHEGSIDRWKMTANYGWTTQHDGLGEAAGGRDLIIFREDVHGVGYGNQPIVGTRITYRRVKDTKGLRAEMVCMIDNPHSVAAFIKFITDEMHAFNSGKVSPHERAKAAQGYDFPAPNEIRRGPIPSASVQRARKDPLSVPDRTPPTNLTGPIIFKDMTPAEKREETRKAIEAEKRRRDLEAKTVDFI